MTVGPLVMAAGTLWLLRGRSRRRRGGATSRPGLTVFGLGLALMVAPLTATVLAAAPDEVAGIASGINNAVARAGSLLAVAALPMAVGLAGDDYRDPARFDTAYGTAMIACAVLLVARRPGLVVHDPQPRPHTGCLGSGACAYDEGRGWRRQLSCPCCSARAASRQHRAEPDPAPASEPSSAEPTEQASTRPGGRPRPRRRPARRARRPAVERRHPRAVGQAARRRAASKKIETLEGVAHTERIGLGQVSLENRVLTVASVDPARYRHFTQAEVADFQEAWDRVAGGELAIDRKVAKRLADKDGMIRLGTEDDAPDPARGRVHPADPDHRHGRQHRVGRGHRDGHRQRPADLDRPQHAGQHPQAARAAGRQGRVGADARRRLAASASTPTPGSPPSRPAARSAASSAPSATA